MNHTHKKKANARIELFSKHFYNLSIEVIDPFFSFFVGNLNRYFGTRKDVLNNIY
jgi:hypothetical protein